MESQPKNPEFRNNPENFHPCIYNKLLEHNLQSIFQPKKLHKICNRHFQILTLPLEINR